MEDYKESLMDIGEMGGNYKEILRDIVQNYKETLVLMQFPYFP